MVSSLSSGELRLMEEASSEIEAAAKAGDPHARSVLGLLYHFFAALGGNLQSKMALAHFYARQDVRLFCFFSSLQSSLH
ncbi:hypothetical protein BVRB_8g190160 [Beta vulgaris subsp. vulgaris]|nr:hypothetical protein BVRB_8g190160 [Beta vulgaris subsp. vulgaris]